jgi:hypothetical protein
MNLTDPIVDELHRVRQQLLDQHHGSFDDYFASLLRAQREQPHKYEQLVTPPAVSVDERSKPRQQP